MDLTGYREIIAFAIKNEIEARQFYADAAQKVSDSYIKQMFTDFSEEEKKHEQILTGILGRKSFEGYFTETRDYKVAESVDRPKLSIDMKPADAIALAMKNEEEAMKLYGDLAEKCTDNEIRNVFLDLAAMERGHKFKMEQAFVDIGYPEVW
jgi:rubrerythrin